jgi:hypothetical protein
MLADSPGFDNFHQSLANEDAALAKFGLGYFRGTDPVTQFILPAGSAGVLAGALIHRHQTEQRAQFGSGGSGGATGLQQDEPGDLLRRGRIWVPVIGAVTAGGRGWLIHTTANFGSWRADAGGVAEVSTLTPNPIVNDVVYTVDIHIGDEDYHFEMLGDASATATEICDGIRAAMALDATFTALVVATGTTTLILTGQNIGQELDVVSSGEGLFDIVETTPPATAAQLVNGSWLSSTSGSGLALLELNEP